MVDHQIEITEVQRLGKEALLLSARLKRPVSKDDLILTLRVPWNLLDPVWQGISQVHPVPLDRLPPSERARLNGLSKDVVAAALQADGRRIEKKGLSLAAVAASSPRDWTLDQVKQLYGYIEAVLQLTTLPPRESWPIGIQDLARKASALPEGERTLFRLVTALGIGVYDAKLVKAVVG